MTITATQAGLIDPGYDLSDPAPRPERGSFLNLVSVEQHRLWTRGATWLLSAVLIVILLGLSLLQLMDATPISPEEYQSAQAMYQEQHDDWVEHADEIQQACLDNGGTAEECAVQNFEPQLESYLRNVPTFATLSLGLLANAPIITAVIVILIAALFIGTEFSSGSVANWLTFVPNRNSVFWSKIAALSIAAIGLSLLASLLSAVSSWLIAVNNGLDRSIPDGFWTQQVLPMVGFGAVAALTAMLGATALGFITKGAIGVISVMFGYLVIFEAIVPNVLGYGNSFSQYLLSNNAMALIKGVEQLPIGTCSTTNGRYSCTVDSIDLTRDHALIEFGIIIAVLLFVAWFAFRKRDVND
jgi:ABC-2 type transport system permease protein